MSENTQPPSKNEEVDLAQIFNYIDKLFQKIGKLVSGLFKFLLVLVKKAAVLLLFCINIIKSKFLFLSIAFIVGLALTYFLGKTMEKSYSSQMIIEQNFDTGNILSGQISSLSSLAKQRDSIELSKILKIPVKNASKIKNFSLEHIIDKNRLMVEYSEFIKESDSINSISFDQYLDNKILDNSPVQFIIVTSKDPSIYTGLEKQILNLILSNEFLPELKEKEINVLKRKKATILQTLQKSDTLQNSYFQLLEKYYRIDNETKSPRADISLSLDRNSKDKINTKEYELFIESSKLRQELNEIESKIEAKSNIFSIQKGFSSPVLLEKVYYETKLFFPLLFCGLTFLFFLLKVLGFGGVLNKYGTKEELIKSEK